jgi:Uma2 family endonuclease
LSPSPGFEHADRSNQLNLRIGFYLTKNPIAKVVMECDVLLPDGGDVFRPDISFILVSNFHIVKKHIHGTPDIVVEVLSPSTRKNTWEKVQCETLASKILPGLVFKRTDIFS